MLSLTIAGIISHSDGDCTDVEAVHRKLQVDVIPIVLTVGRRFIVGWRNKREATHTGTEKASLSVPLIESVMGSPSGSKTKSR